MQRIITLLFVVFSFSAQAQWYWAEQFEQPNDSYRDRFVFDSTHAGNKWQIGRPQKSIFDSAYSVPNALVTDSVHTYPGHDTSVVTLMHFPYVYSPMFSLTFYYKLDMHPGALVKIEISGDRGQNWIDPMTEDTTYMFYWGGPKPRLDTQVHNWTKFELNMEDWGNAFAGGPLSFPHYRIADTVLFRFTYATGAIATTHDGWVMDNFEIENPITEGYVSQVRNDDLLQVYPNPSKGALQLNSGRNDDAKIEVSDLAGRLLYRTMTKQAATSLELPVPDGIYILKYISDKNYAVKRVVVQH
ncbi:MAG: T9SS type A sorting domain-containing protein [Bacteroidetes bacterium]|nr:T9SS type A sorting domain-containing protein [Bacteroidota bacterium]